MTRWTDPGWGLRAHTSVSDVLLEKKQSTLQNILFGFASIILCWKHLFNAGMYSRQIIFIESSDQHDAWLWWTVPRVVYVSPDHSHTADSMTLR